MGLKSTREEEDNVKYYLAPLEGITGYIYRNAYRDCFGGIDKYFIPFIQPKQRGNFSTREINDILPEHNIDMNAVPQILTNCAEDFLETAKKLESFGYRELNLNLGCPSKTVVSKGRGAGFLADTDKLDRFLEEIFRCCRLSISIKTRIGKQDPEEFQEILEIYQKYPLSELIIHPRVQKDFYKNQPNWEVFREAVNRSRIPLCYNGDINCVQDFQNMQEAFPQVERVMIGRGILQNPGLVPRIKDGTVLTKEQLKQFHDRIYRGYCEVLYGDKTVLFKMKELWLYMIPIFSNCEKYRKKIKKAERLRDYEEMIGQLFREEELLTDGQARER